MISVVKVKAPSVLKRKKYILCFQLFLAVKLLVISTSNVESFLPFIYTSRKRTMTPKSASAIISENKDDKHSIAINHDDNNDPYSYLEEVESEESLNFARNANDNCLSTLGDPSKKESSSYKRILNVLESKDRIPYVTKLGENESGDDVVYNFWKDENNTKGIWRKTTLSSYSNEEPEWEVILDLDELSKEEDISWVWKGYRPLHYTRDPDYNDGSSTKQITRCLVYLSNGGADAITVREFDLLTNQFLSNNNEAFHVAKEAKTSISYKHRDLVLIGTELDKSDLTDSGYPRTVREWARGTKLEDAPIVFEGDATDVSVGAFVNDQRHRYGGTIYEVRYRSLTFYTSVNYVRTSSFDQLISSSSPEDEFVKLDVQDDAETDFFGPYLFILLRSNWDVGSNSYQKGSLLAVRYDSFLTEGKDNVDYQVLFEPSDTTALEHYRATKNYLILHTMDNVKSKMIFYKLNALGELVSISPSAQAGNGNGEGVEIRDMSCSGVDALENDLVWCTVSGYTLPTSLYIGDISLIEQESSDKNTSAGTSFLTQRLKSLPSQYDASGVVVEQKFAISKDGTSVPYFLIYDPTKSIPGKAPTLLYGYGGFEISLTPRYIASTGLSWIEKVNV